MTRAGKLALWGTPIAVVAVCVLDAVLIAPLCHSTDCSPDARGLGNTVFFSAVVAIGLVLAVAAAVYGLSGSSAGWGSWSSVDAEIVLTPC